MESRYYKFSEFLQKKYGQRLWKVNVDAGFTCPNLDGSISRDGCIYCDNLAFGKSLKKESLESQIERGISFARNRYKADKFILYFQSYTGTYGSKSELTSVYSVIRKHKDFKVLSVGTRPDCIDDDSLEALSEFVDEYDVWVELGLQSAHDRTLQLINRGHDYDTFVEAVTKLHSINVSVFAHVIIGLPGEDRDDILNTARRISDPGLTGVKIHPLHIVKNTALEKMYLDGKYSPMDFDEYIDVLISFLELLPPEYVIARVTADVQNNLLVAPEWIKDKSRLLVELERRMKESNRVQGGKYHIK